MNLPPGLRRLFRLAVRPPSPESEIADEVRDHLARRTEDLVARGWSPEAARAEAVRRFGSIPQITAACQVIDAHRERVMARREWFSDIRHDLRFAIRSLRRAPGAALVAALTFALGIGVNAAVFSLVDGVVFKPLPYTHADRIVRIYEADTQRETGQVTIADFRDWRDLNTTFDAMAAFRFGSAILNTETDNTILSAGRVTANFFDLLGVRPALGRGFAPEEELTGAAPVAVLSHRAWQDHFGGDPALVGREVQLNGAAATVIGVLGAEFVTPMGSDIDLWLTSDFEVLARDARRARGMHVLATFGRLRPGTSFDQAASDLRAIGARLEAAYPDRNTGHRPNPVPLGLAGIQSARGALLLVMGAVGLVLLTACANLANLVFARALGRSQEFAVRAALGADRRRLTRQVLTEHSVLALSGGLIGVVAAGFAIRGIALWLAPVIPRAERVTLDARVIVFALGLTVVAAVISGILPASLASRAAGQPSLRGEARSSTVSRGGRRMRAALVSAQVALAVVLLVGAGLVVRSLTRLLATDLGFEPERVVTFGTPLIGPRYGEPAARADFQSRFLERLAALPGVTAAGVTYSPPMQNVSTTSFDLPDRPFPTGQHPEVGYNTASHGLFAALGIPLHRGRLMDDSRDHAEAPPVVIINERLAQQYWPGQDPVGQFIKYGSEENPLVEVIGVVGDIRRSTVDQAPGPELYFAASQDLSSNPSFAVRTSGDPGALAAGIRTALRELDPSLPVANLIEMTDLVNGTLFRPRFLATLFSLFAALAMVLAAIGIYGVIAYIVAEQVREIGIRRALGATDQAVWWQILGRGMAPVVAGLAIGLALAIGLSGMVRSMLYGVAPFDPPTLLIAAAVTLAAGLIGCLAPTWRATRIEPVVALREG